MKKTIIKIQRWIPFLLVGGMMGLTGCVGDFGLMPGRPLRIEDELVITKVHLGEGSHWAKGQRPITSHLNESTRLALEALWLQDARGEHASIPAFSRISWQLSALGSPPELLEWAHKAALEEINHAKLCFALAEGYGGRSYFVQPIPEMLRSGQNLVSNSIEVIATETIFDGCLTEGFFAKLAALALVQCEEPATFAALQQIAHDEESHANFSWAFLEWLLKEHPTKVKAIIQNAYFNLETYHRPKTLSAEQKRLIEKADSEQLIKHGRLPEEQWQKIWDDHVVKTQQNLQQLLDSNANLN